MLKDAFNRKKQKEQPSAAPQPPTPALTPNEDNRPKSLEELTETTTTQEGVVTTQSLAALALQRLVENFDTQTLEAQQHLSLTEEYAPGPALTEGQLVGGFQQAQPCDLSGSVINELYQIEGILARGGMGQVLLCTHLQRDIKVVMKLMLRQADSDDTAFQRFMQECRVTSRLRHPNLVKVLDYGILLEGLKPYLVMEFVEGQSLRGILKSKFALNAVDIAQILMQACCGLLEVHSRGIIHRDLKPENLMIRGDMGANDNVKILDFGIAQLQKDKRFDEEGWAIGSIGYMSPEQVCGQPVDHRTDVYSLGLIFYEAITGRPPFRGRSSKETMAMHVKAPVIPPSQIVHCENAQTVDKICTTALAKDPNHRYASVKDMQDELSTLVK